MNRAAISRLVKIVTELEAFQFAGPHESGAEAPFEREGSKINQGGGAPMKRNTAVLISAIFIVSLALIAYAAETSKGTVKSVDTKAGTITFCPEGTTKDMTLKADKSIDLGKVKPETKVEVILDKDTVKGIKEMKKPKAPVGC